MRFRIIPFLLFLLVALFSAGCSRFAQPQDLSMFTPIPTAMPLQEALAARGEIVTDPVSGPLPGIDPVCQTLVDAVSQQQLIGYVQTLENFGTRNSFSDQQRSDFGIGAAGRWIFEEFQRVGGGRLQVEFQDYPFNFQGQSTTQRNVIATLPGNGSHPGAIVLMANYDTRPEDWLDGISLSPGADDNASGVANLLETARLLSSGEWNQTMIFVATTAEEQGTYGSRYFVQDAVLDGMLIDAAINNDMIGGRTGIPQSVRLFADGEDTSNHLQLARYIDYVGGLYLPTFPIQTINALDREGRWGDHREFVNAGIPSVRLIESEEDLDIQNSRLDSWELIDYDYFEKIVQLNLSVLCNMVGGPPPPPAPSISQMSEPGSFLLNWPVAPEADGYAISFRPVGSETYPPFRFVGTSQAGDVVLTGLDPDMTYGVSLAALDENGRLGNFSPEVIVGPHEAGVDS
jgi:hypothetical protein